MNELLRYLDLKPRDPLMILVGAVLFLVLWQLLDRLVFKPFLALIEAREAATTGVAQSVEANLAQAQALTDEYNNLVDEARLAAVQKKLAILTEARAKADKLVAEAELKAKQMSEEARTRAASERDALWQSALKDSDKLTEEIVRKVGSLQVM